MGNFCNNLITKSLASLLTYYQSLSSKSNSYWRIALNINISELPLKGGYPQSKMYIMIPQDQMSALESYCLFITSGAT